jgi:hypothetical protein
MLRRFNDMVIPPSFHFRCVSKIKTPAGLLASPVFVREALSSNQSLALEGEYSSQQIDVAATGSRAERPGRLLGVDRLQHASGRQRRVLKRRGQRSIQAVGAVAPAIPA